MLLAKERPKLIKSHLGFPSSVGVHLNNKREKGSSVDLSSSGLYMIARAIYNGNERTRQRVRGSLFVISKDGEQSLIMVGHLRSRLLVPCVQYQMRVRHIQRQRKRRVPFRKLYSSRFRNSTFDIFTRPNQRNLCVLEMTSIPSQTAS